MYFLTVHVVSVIFFWSTQTHKFLSFLGSTTHGWIRDLTNEGIESNPGPTWKEYVDHLKKKYEEDEWALVDKELANIKTKMKEEYKKDIVDTTDLIGYLAKRKLGDATIQRSLEEALQQLSSGMLFNVSFCSNCAGSIASVVSVIFLLAISISLLILDHSLTICIS